jgi:uncharacterized protein YndB with AHSA1/START domain
MEKSVPIIVEQSFNHPANTVWKAITEPERMRKWFFENIPDFEPIEGFETRFNVHSGERNFEHRWRLTEVIDYQKIVYQWSYTEYEGEGRVSFELIPRGNATLLRLTNTGLESFPREIPEFSRESCRAGWEYFISQNLTEYLNNQ